MLVQNGLSCHYNNSKLPSIIILIDMKHGLRTESDESSGMMFDIEENASSTRKHFKHAEYYDRKPKSKKKLILHPKVHDPKISTYSSSSRLTSLIKGNISEAEIAPFKISHSTYFNQLTQKYVTRGAPIEKIKQQMQLALERRTSEIQALRVHRDELKFISSNNPYDKPIKLSLAILKEKARTEENMKNLVMTLQKDIKEIQFQQNIMTDYYNFMLQSLKSGNKEEDLIIDTHEEEQLMIENLEKETNHLFRELKEEDKKNAKQIKIMQEQIASLRVYIKQKEDKIRDLKSKICTMHIKLHSRGGSSSKEKNLSLSIRKFISQQNGAVQEAFVGNTSFKSYSKELLEKVDNTEELQKIVFLSEKNKESIGFKLIYKTYEGKTHNLQNVIGIEPGQDNTLNMMINNHHQFVNSYQRAKEVNVEVEKEHGGVQTTEIKLKYLLSLKFYFKSKVVGIECRLKTQRGNQHIQIGNCAPYLEHQLLTLINKKIITVGSYWHQKSMIGVGVWYSSKDTRQNNISDYSDRDNHTKENGKALKNVRSDRKISKNKQPYYQYYQN